MDHAPKMTLSSTVLGAPDARELAAFYQQIFGWTVVEDAASECMQAIWRKRSIFSASSVSWVPAAPSTMTRTLL